MDSLDFGEDDVHVGAGDVLAVDDLAVFAQFGPVLPVQLLPRGLRVSVDGELPESREKLLHVSAVRHDGKISAAESTAEDVWRKSVHRADDEPDEDTCECNKVSIYLGDVYTLRTNIQVISDG